MPFTLSSPDFTNSSDTPTTLNAAQATEQDIWTQMRQGTGYVVLLRHAQTVSGTGDPPGFRLEDCSTQRNLSAAGRDQAVRIGRVFRDRHIPFAQVLSSQYCRCLETAKLLDLGAVTPSPMLNSIFEDHTTATQQTQQVRQQILNHRNSM
ncbi:histidine phosphatase family protein [Chroococcidiopsis sp.]|uniref:histidine phosphatase family protein n=1 Tax=Chroococcidiopsis sp. TaxID=3088168 RepID=UPI003F32E81B